MKRIYLAIPYTGMEEFSFQVANQIAGHLMKEGYAVFSPISHCHMIAKTCGLPTVYSFWKEYDRINIQDADIFMVVRLPGWERSVGIEGEYKDAQDMGKDLGSALPMVLKDPQYRQKPIVKFSFHVDNEAFGIIPNTPPINVTTVYKKFE